MTRPDYDSDNDPLGYMTTNYPIGARGESANDMSRRALVRGRYARKRWQRTLVWVWIVGSLGMILFWAVYFLASLVRRTF